MVTLLKFLLSFVELLVNVPPQMDVVAVVGGVATIASEHRPIAETMLAAVSWAAVLT